MSWREFVTWGKLFEDKTDEALAAKGGPDAEEDVIDPEEMTATDVSRVFGVRIQ